jgi:hypothetical protein
MNKFMLCVIGLLLLLALVGYGTMLSQTFMDYANELLTVAEDLGIIMMLINGTFVATRLFKVALFFVGLAVLGFLFKIMHLPGADEFLLYPFVVLFGLYVIHFFNKRAKARLDVFKVVMMISFLVLPPCIMLHLIPEEYKEVIFLVSHVLFWLTFLDFLYTSRKQGVLLKRQQAEPAGVNCAKDGRFFHWHIFYEPTARLTAERRLKFYFPRLSLSRLRADEWLSHSFRTGVSFRKG